MDTATFWNHVAAYNEATWLIQAVMIVCAIYLTYRVFARPGSQSDAWMKAFLAFAFGWSGIVFFLVFIQNPVSMVTGAPLFILVSIFFVVDIFTQKTHFRFPESKWMKAFTVAWVLLALLYPLFGWLLGHVYPRTLLSLFPCPLTVFAIALVTAAAPQADKKIWVALLPWALMGLPKCFGALDCYEDCVLFAAGVFGLIALVKNWRLIEWQQQRTLTTG